MPIEVEARFRVEDPEVLTWLATIPRLGDVQLGTPSTFSETDAYLDTAEGALGAARWACRLRRRGRRVTVSLKGPREPASGGWLHRRPELEGPATEALDPEAWPASEARDALDRLRGGRPVDEFLRLEQRRTERPVALEGQRIGTLSLDEVAAWHGDDVLARFAIVELELADAPGATEALMRAGAGLAQLPGLVPEPRSKLERALEALAAR